MLIPHTRPLNVQSIVIQHLVPYTPLHCGTCIYTRVAGETIASIFHKDPSTTPAIGDINSGPDVASVNGDSTTTIESGSTADGGSGGDEGVRVVASANDYGVAHLDLEGDSNCEYTTKVMITGSEYNVIIDTGSAHFAVASDACKDPYEEEEIPIDEDIDLVAATADGSSGNISNAALSGDQHPLSLFKVRPNKDRPGSGVSLASAGSSTTITTTTTTTTSSTTSSLLGRSSSSSGSSAYITSTTASFSSAAALPGTSGHTSVITSISVTQRPIVSSHPSAATQDAFHVGANARFPDNKDRLRKLQDIVTGAVRHGVPITREETTKPKNGKVYKRRRIGTDGGGASGRALVAAPAENLYPPPVNAREQGELIRVSYGIKTHSVGWSGVMTSDLMTLDIAKVRSGNTTDDGSSPALIPGTQHLEDGGSMEKETNVGLAAIMENSGFFSQECGTQPGIWGLGYRSLSVDRKPTLFDILSASMKIPNGFTLQLCGRVGNTTKSGNMFLGGYSSAHLAEPMQFVPLVKRDWYQVRLDGFKVMGRPIHGIQNLNVPKTIVDSGTTNILMSHYNLQFLVDALSQSEVVRWSNLIPKQDINNFWFRNAVLRLPRSSFRVATMTRAVEVVMSGVAVPIYTSSFLRIKPIPAGQAPEGYVDFWWHGFASSTAPDAIEAKRASVGAVTPGSVGTILGEMLFAGKVVYFERGNENAQPGDADFGRIGFGRGKNCFAPADHRNIDVLASQGQVVDLVRLGPVRVAATCDASEIRLGGSNGGGLDVYSAGVHNGNGQQHAGDDTGVKKAGRGGGGGTQPVAGRESSPQIHFHGLDGPIRLMGGAGAATPRPWSSHLGLFRSLGAGLLVALLATSL
ncbi:Beta-site APP-cleaving enzyme [Mortierella sp. GBA35]|nr:Beta-site APP-cleaving enzyme [Mortierella sp. GBA35]